MFRITPVNSWLDFETMMHERMIRDAREVSYQYYFRGQADAAWPLKTTLERFVSPNLSVSTYYSVIHRLSSPLETFTDRRWVLPDRADYLRAILEGPGAAVQQTNEYMAYLRQFGFPSPFLDWTMSPFVAAFFAFRDVGNPATHVAIFEYLEVDVGGDHLREYPQILAVMASSRNNKRYYLQQGASTVCMWTDGTQAFYAPHENSRSLAEDTEVITKYVLPADERAEALRSLNAYNINAYSLIGTEESLLETLFLGAYQNAVAYRSYFHSTNDDEAWS